MNVDISRRLQALRTRYSAPLLRRAARFWRWWRDQLISQLPNELRLALSRRSERLFISVDGGLVTMCRSTHLDPDDAQDADASTTLAAPSGALPDSRLQVLILEGEKVLQTSLRLPLAAEENLAEVLTFEMDKYTPFAVDEIYFDYRVGERDVARQLLRVDIVFARRDVVDQDLDAARARGLAPGIVTCRAGGARQLLDVNLLPAGSLPGRRGFDIRPNTVIAGICAVLLVAVVATPLWQKHQLIEDIRPRVDQAAAVANESATLRQDVEALATGTRMLEAKKQSRLMIVQLVDEVSRILPDHTWLSRLDIADSELQIHGQSSSSAELIAIVESSAMLHNAQFRSPVIQIPGTDQERFHLSADIFWGSE